MYTELNICVNLRKNTPQNIIDILKYMLGDIDEPPELTDHPLFKTERWTFMLRCTSRYFAGYTHSGMVEDDYDYHLNVRCSLKNYYSEIDQFLNFIAPYLSSYHGSFLGYTRYEEYDDPLLIYYDFDRKTVRYV